MRERLEGRVKGANDDVESYPNNNQPARPIEAIEHKHAAQNLQNPGDVYVPMRLEIRKAISGGDSTVWQQACKQGDASKHDEYQTDDRD